MKKKDNVKDNASIPNPADRCYMTEMAGVIVTPTNDMHQFTISDLGAGSRSGKKIKEIMKGISSSKDCYGFFARTFDTERAYYGGFSIPNYLCFTANSIDMISSIIGDEVQMKVSIGLDVDCPFTNYCTGEVSAEDPDVMVFNTSSFVDKIGFLTSYILLKNMNTQLGIFCPGDNRFNVDIEFVKCAGLDIRRELAIIIHHLNQIAPDDFIITTNRSKEVKNFTSCPKNWKKYKHNRAYIRLGNTPIFGAISLSTGLIQKLNSITFNVNVYHTEKYVLDNDCDPIDNYHFTVSATDTKSAFQQYLFISALAPIIVRTIYAKYQSNEFLIISGQTIQYLHKKSNVTTTRTVIGANKMQRINAGLLTMPLYIY